MPSETTPAGLPRDMFVPADLATAGDLAAEHEANGIAGIFTAETAHDPFLPLVEVARRTQRCDIGTGIAVAFARTPMTVAYTARDLNEASGGRMILGLGSQIKPHITKRFSMPWSAPAARMREFVEALHAIWDAWDGSGPLRHKGAHYTHILMSDFFDPGPAQHGRPRVHLAAVGPMMIDVVGAVCDGWMVHPFHTPQTLAEVGLPRLMTALDAAGRTSDDVEVSVPVFVVTGRDEAEMAASAAGIRGQIGFYGSTPAYSAVLEHHGWGEAHRELNRLTKENRWDELGSVIDDEMLQTFAVVAEPDDVATEIDRRYSGLADRISWYTAAPTS